MSDTTYLVIVEECFLATSPEKKTPSVKLKLHATENVATKEGCDIDLWHDLWLTEGAFDRTMDTLTLTLGWNGADLAELNGVVQNPLYGKQAWAVTEPETYVAKDKSTKTRTKVKWLNPVGGHAALPKIEDAEAKTISEKLKGKILAYRQNKNTETPKIKDDLPF